MSKLILRIYKISLIFGLTFCVVIFSCKNDNKKIEMDKSDTFKTTITDHLSQEYTLLGQKTNKLDGNIRSIFQDKKGIFWFGTNSSGVYRYDGKSLKQFTVKDGLYNDQVQTIQEDNEGKIWFGTGIFGVSSFDGKEFMTHISKENFNKNNQYVESWYKTSNDLWFYAGDGVFRYFDNKISDLSFNDKSLKLFQNGPFELSPYAVYSMLKDKKGNLWFGTQSQGVCLYDGKDFTWFTDHGLAGPAVLALFEDSRGNIWMGNNGAGLFKYDGKTLLNFTEKNKLNNPSFRTAGNPQAGTLARINAINEDLMGNIWIGTVDAGVWKYDGNHLTNYTNKDGLISQAINTIYRDKKGNLWFGSDADGIFKFNGNNFEQVNFL